MSNCRSADHRRPGRWRRVALLVVLALVASATGCSRRFYRTWADKQVDQLVYQASRDPRWEITEYNVYTPPCSRMYDPNCLDRPPMPPDDPVSHQLMHCVNGIPGYPFWHRYGDLTSVEDRTWEQCLPWNDDQEVELDMSEAVLVARVNSRDYQSQLEELYLSALDVTFERFRFESQFFGGNDTFLTLNGRNRATRATRTVYNDANNLGFNRLFPAGGQLVVEAANNFVWNLAGPDQFRPTTVLNFSLLQPLLRGGGRRFVLETLTLAERSFLSNVRSMQRYRQAFYVDLTTGRGSGGTGPARIGGVFGGSGLENFTGVGGGFGRFGGGGAGGFTGGAGAAQAGGFLGLLQTRREIENQRLTVEELRKSHDRLYELAQADRLDKLQVDQAAQALADATSRLLTSETQYQTTLDTYKIQMGLPPCLSVEINDPQLDMFQLIDPDMREFEQRAETLVPELMPSPDDAEDPTAYLTALQRATRVLKQMTEMTGNVQRELLPRVEEKYKKLADAEGQRKKSLDELKKVAKRRNVVDDPETRLRLLTEHQEIIRADLEKLKIIFSEPGEGEGPVPPPPMPAPGDDDKGIPWKEWLDDAPIADVLAGLQTLLDEVDLPMSAPDAAWLEREVAPGLTEAGRIEMLFASIWQMAERLQAQAPQLYLTNARAQLETLVLPANDLEECRAMEIASYNRLDWMNARASLVDQWRRIEFRANALLSVLNLRVSGDIANADNVPFKYRDTNGTLRVGFEWDAPLNRLSERNLYRQVLIDYQQARRNYMLYVDNVDRQFRNTLRTMDLNQLNFELRRQAVWIAIDQVEQAEVRLIEPPRPGADATQDTLGPTTARDVVSALSDLLSTQNDFLSVWVNYQVLRMQLDFDLGTMQLDDQGLWIDPGTIGAVSLPSDACGLWTPPEVEFEEIPAGEKDADERELPEPRNLPGMDPDSIDPDADDPDAVPFEDIRPIPGDRPGEEPPIGPEVESEFEPRNDATPPAEAEPAEAAPAESEPLLEEPADGETTNTEDSAIHERTRVQFIAGAEADLADRPAPWRARRTGAR